MFSKKEEFTNIIQYKIGERIDDLKSTDYDSIDDLANLFERKNDAFNWKTLHFLNIYYVLKENIETLTSQSINSETDLNALLNKKQKKEVIELLKRKDIKPIELSRPSLINKVVFLFPIISILGAMLMSTYLITAKDYSGWIYLSGLLGIVLSLGLFKITSNLKTQFSPNTLLDFAKSTYVIRYKKLSQTPNTKEQLLNFLLEELELVYHKKYSSTESIPEK